MIWLLKIRFMLNSDMTVHTVLLSKFSTTDPTDILLSRRFWTLVLFFHIQIGLERLVHDWKNSEESKVGWIERKLFFPLSPKTEGEKCSVSIYGSLTSFSFSFPLFFLCIVPSLMTYLPQSHEIFHHPCIPPPQKKKKKQPTPCEEGTSSGKQRMW